MAAAVQAKPRLIVTTDIGGDPDDQQSMVRLLVYSNEFDIEALIASASGTPGELSSAQVRPDLIREQVGAYGDVRAKLVLHASGYPTEQYLLDRVKSGNKYRGTDYIGSGHDTEGSNYIISVVDKSDSRPVNVSIWGGQTDLAQALWKVKNSRSTTAYKTFAAKLRVHDIADQDGIFSYLRSNFPEVWYVLDKTRTSDKCSSVFRGMFYQGNTATVTLTWLRTNIKNNHGALGALYPDEGLWSCGNGINGIKEGDTPSWFYFMDNGMHVPSEPTYGGWGGRFKVEGTNYWRDDTDTYDGDTRSTATVYRWRSEYQSDFQARMDWCVKTYDGANHNPVAAVNAAAQTVASGDAVVLDAAGSTDPDGNGLSYTWMYYKEPGTWGGSLSITNAASRAASFIAPDVTSDKTVHIILKVKDNGSPALTSYKRVVVTVQPASSSNHAPAATITAPAAGDTLYAGDNLEYSGTGTDDEDGDLGSSALAWRIDRLGDGLGDVHTSTGASGSYTLPGDIDSPTEYRVYLIATDAGGLTDTDMRSVIVTERPASPVLPSGDGRIEAEDMELSGYTVQDLASASGGQVVRTAGAGEARCAYDGTDGVRDIVVAYYEENDGESDYVLYLNGTEIDRWTSDEDRGSADPDVTSAALRTVEDVVLASGDEIKITGTQDVGEFGRVDYIETVVQPVSGVHAPEVRTVNRGQVQGRLFDTNGRVVTVPGPGVYFRMNAGGNGFMKVIITR